MSIAEVISRNCVRFITTNLSKSEEEAEIINYGLQSLLINIFKFIILFLTAYFLRIIPYAVVAFISFGLLRTFASGVHADSSLKCIITNYIIFLGNVYMSLHIKLRIPMIVGGFAISLLLMLRYSPADTSERPLISKKLRKSLKYKSLVTVVIFGGISLILSDTVYARIITISVLAESLLITPFAYRVFRKSYNNYLNYKQEKGVSR